MSIPNKASGISSHNSLLTLAEVATFASVSNEDSIENRIKSPSQTYKNNQCVKPKEICAEIKSTKNSSCLKLFKNQSDEIVVKRKKKFPETIMDILSSHEDTITWLPRGNAFVIIDKEKLINNVLPLYFKHIQYRSFVTRLFRW